MDTEHRSALPSVLRESLEKEGAALTGAGRRKNIHMGLWACIEFLVCSLVPQFGSLWRPRHVWVHAFALGGMCLLLGCL